MKNIHFNVEENGFYGDFQLNKKNTNAAIIAMIGDDSSDYLAKTAVKWLFKMALMY